VATHKQAVGILAVKKLTGQNIITVAARHNKREIQAEIGASGRIDATRSGLNQSLVGPSDAAGVGELAKSLMMAAGVVKTRSDAVLGIEVVFSLPPDHALDDVAYFSDCTAWAGGYFAGAEILSADIHRDEAAPHCHALILPLVDGRMVGSDLFGGRPKLAFMTKHFHENVASRYGLGRAPKRLRTMAQIFTSPGKGPRTEQTEPHRVCNPKKSEPHALLGFASNPVPESAYQPPTDKAFAGWLEGVIQCAVDRAVTAAMASVNSHQQLINKP
jgi:hypothetical protein